MQGVGFTDEVDPVDLEKIVRGARHRLTELRPFRVTIGPPQLDPEGLPMPVRPVEPLREVRNRVREAIAEVWGGGEAPEAAEDWWPHVTLAYANAAGSIQPVAEALAAQPARMAEVEISTVSLIQLNRDDKLYTWVEVCRLTV
jgi:2'-5' RNA ligase